MEQGDRAGRQGSMITSEAPIQDAAAPVKWQFTVGSLLWLMVTVGMCLAYARPFGPPAMTLVLAAPVGAVVVGSCFAAWYGSKAAIYWAVVAALLGCVCVIPAHLSPLTFTFWPCVGGVAGAYCGACRPQITIWTVMGAIGIGILSIALFMSPLQMDNKEFLLDAAGAPAVCLALAVLIRLVEWLRTTYGTSRDAWAAGLVFAVIGGNLVAAAIDGRAFQ
jgi:hypothetical protein